MNLCSCDRWVWVDEFVFKISCKKVRISNLMVDKPSFSSKRWIRPEIFGCRYLVLCASARKEETKGNDSTDIFKRHKTLLDEDSRADGYNTDKQLQKHTVSSMIQCIRYFLLLSPCSCLQAGVSSATPLVVSASLTELVSPNLKSKISSPRSEPFQPSRTPDLLTILQSYR